MRQEELKPKEGGCAPLLSAYLAALHHAVTIDPYRYCNNNGHYAVVYYANMLFCIMAIIPEKPSSTRHNAMRTLVH